MQQFSYSRLKCRNVLCTSGRIVFTDLLSSVIPCAVSGVQVCGYIGKAAFSTALECRDLRRRRGEDAVCLKVIKNNKDFFDQSLDEIKLLQRIKDGGDPVCEIVIVLKIKF